MRGFTGRPVLRSCSINGFHVQRDFVIHARPNLMPCFVSGGKRDGEKIMPAACDHCSERSSSWPDHSSHGGRHPRRSCLQHVPIQRHNSLVITLNYRTTTDMCIGSLILTKSNVMFFFSVAFFHDHPAVFILIVN